MKKNIYNVNLNKRKETNEEINFNTVYFWNSTLLKNEMHRYSLYNSFKFPLISLILINNNNFEFNDVNIVRILEYIGFQDLINIEIIFVIKNSSLKDYNLIGNRFTKFALEKNNMILLNGDDEPKNIYSNIINKIQGKHTIFINSFNVLKKIKITQLYKSIKGKIDNYFNISLTKNLNTYLIRAKILKDLNDNGIKFNSFENILNTVKFLSSPFMNYIPISLCPNNNYTNLAYVAMSSILSSKATNTYICFYLIVPDNFKKRNYKIFDSLHEEYDYFNITYYKMDNRYDKAYTSNHITIQAYYRFSLGEILQNWNKTIYIDSDVVVYKDLSNFYNLNFNGKMFLAYPTIGNKKKHIEINSGIILMNLYEMRKNKFEKRVRKIIKNVKFLILHDQTILNKYFRNYIGIFPPEYHTRPWSNYKEMSIFNYKTDNIFDNDYLYFAHKYPTIRHFFGYYKPLNPNINHIEDWWFFARKSKYYNESADIFQYSFSF